MKQIFICEVIHFKKPLEQFFKLLKTYCYYYYCCYCCYLRLIVIIIIVVVAVSDCIVLQSLMNFQLPEQDNDFDYYGNSSQDESRDSQGRHYFYI